MTTRRAAVPTTHRLPTTSMTKILSPTAAPPAGVVDGARMSQYRTDLSQLPVTIICICTIERTNE